MDQKDFIHDFNRIYKKIMKCVTIIPGKEAEVSKLKNDIDLLLSFGWTPDTNRGALEGRRSKSSPSSGGTRKLKKGLKKQT